MATVTGKFTIRVGQPAPPPPPPPSSLVLTPNSVDLPSEQEGVNVVGDAVTVVSGGTPPYKYANVAGLPPGMDLKNTIEADGSETITVFGTPSSGDAAGGPNSDGVYNVSFDVSDSAPTPVVATFGAKAVVK